VNKPMSLDCVVSKLHRRQLKLDGPLSRQNSTEQELEHYDVAGLGEFDCLAHQIFCLAIQQRRGDGRPYLTALAQLS
jgi:hypothetical protein